MQAALRVITCPDIAPNLANRRKFFSTHVLSYLIGAVRFVSTKNPNNEEFSEEFLVIANLERLVRWLYLSEKLKKKRPEHIHRPPLGVRTANHLERAVVCQAQALRRPT